MRSVRHEVGSAMRWGGKRLVYDSVVTAPAFDPLVAALTASERHGHGVYLGASLGPAGGVRPVFARPQHGVLLLGPPRSGKTTSVVVPNVLAACGPVVAASTKADVLAATCAARARLGPVLLYDPSGAVPCPAGVERVAWSPLGLAGSWDGAVLVAESMVRAARPGTDRGEASHWSERAGALLAVLFHAAALERRPFAEVVAAVDRHDPDEARAPLARHQADRALNLLEGIVATEGRELSGIWSTASGVLAGYRTDAALASTEGRQLDAAVLLDGRATLYICAGSDQQRHAAPLVAGVLRQVRSAAYERCLSATVAASGDQSTLTPRAGSGPPLLLVLDELANIAPLHDLPTLVAEGAGQGVLTLACLQDLAQARARWDREADGFLSLFGTKLVFPGIGDTRTLEALSLLAGEHDVPTLSVSRGSHRFGLGASRRATTRTVSLRSERRLPVEAIARGHAGCVLGFEGVEPGFLQLTPWHATSPFREAVRDGRARSRGRTEAIPARETLAEVTASRFRTFGR
jgi:type IV secretion system protein VirD4